jgi:hypothetical protein
MALVLKDRVKETTTTTGTGTVTLAGAAAGFQSFVVIGDGNQTFYAIVDATSGDWEVGVGAYTASGTTLSRATVVSSSNAGSLVNFGAGSKDVFVTYPSSRAVYLDAAGSAVSVLDIGTLGTSTANITTANITAGTVSTTPTSANDLVNKTYVDTLAASGIHFHQPVRVESPINLNATYNNGTAGVGATLTNAGTQAALVIDGVTVSVADRVLVYQQTTQTQNGIYVVSDVGSGSTNWILTRSSDADTYVINSAAGLSEGSTVFVQQGATGSGETYTCNTTGVITFGTTNITFAQISSAQIYSAGTGLTLSGTQFSITNTGTAGTYGSASSVPVITTNAQGQVTGVTPTAIAISGAAVSGNISGQAGSVANALTAGTFLTSGGTFDGSAARTFAVDATDANTASKVVARDASGNFSAGTITATLSGAATSATTATNLAGGAANRIAYQTGAGATTFAVAPTASNQVLNWNGSAFTWSAGTISGVALGSNLNTLTFGTYLTGTSYNGSGAVTLATNATNANTASTLVARDASGNFSAGTITAALSGNATTATSATSATSAGNLTGGTISGNYVVNNATSPNSFYLQFGDNTGWTYRFMTSVAGTPTTRFSFGDNGNFTAVGTVAGTNITTGGNVTGNAATVTNGVYTTGAQSIAGVKTFSDTPIFSGGTIQVGSSAGTYRRFRFDGTISSDGTNFYTLLNSNNYTSYSPSLTGSGASGTWGINVTGSATSLNSSNFISQTGSSGNYNTDFTNTPVGTFRYNGDSAGATNNPGGSWWLVQNMRHTNASSSWGTQVAWGWEDNANRLATRNVTSGSFGAWVYYLNSSNVGTYALPISGGTLTGQLTTRVTSGTTPIVSGGGSNSFQVMGDVSNGAWMSFHRGGAYAVNLGMDTSNVVSLGGWSDGGTSRWTSDTSGNFVARGNVTAYSDERLKKDWAPVAEDFIAQLAKVKHGTYTRTDSEERQMGVSAQAMRTFAPEAVLEDSEGRLSLAYGNAALVAAVKLAERVVALEARLAALEAKG